MWPKLKKGVANVLIHVRVPEDEWEKFRDRRPQMSASEQLRMAIKEWMARNK